MLQKWQILSTPPERKTIYRRRDDRITMVITIILVITWVVLLFSMNGGISGSDHPQEDHEVHGLQ